ncbi:hypothetical protein EK21DRAFT_66186 [Setomelanomma holmii]|uniref:Uncharacterized protein n=1 Tax=Setomelanomma holmii TaxID=210430 RepID=A0A9P4HB34_9PLEO|nr:hypothetical protein EK21DRAFT_66186 [Setomelanomma holmii]
MLASHEERCKGEGSLVRNVSHRFILSGPDGPASLILVCRSSGEKPVGWNAGTNSSEEGLPIWGNKIMEHHNAAYGEVTGTVILHSYYEVHSRDLPAPAHNNSFLEKGDRRKEVGRAFRVTQEITDDIGMANQSGITPIILPAGPDALACNLRRIEPWLQSTHLTFTLRLRLTSLNGYMGADHLILDRNVHWTTYSPLNILKVLDQGPGHNAPIDELLQMWRQLQADKDAQFGKKLGRGHNYVDMKASFISPFPI